MTHEHEGPACLLTSAGPANPEPSQARLRDLSSTGALLLTQEGWPVEQRLTLDLLGMQGGLSPVRARVVGSTRAREPVENRWSYLTSVVFEEQTFFEGGRRLPGESHLLSLAAWLPLYTQARTPHIQERVHVSLEDGALLAKAHWLEGRRPAILLVHGVAGSSESQYMHRAAAACLEAGYHAIRLNLRGSGEGRELSRGLYHCGLTDDLHAAVRAFSGHARVEGLLALGFSLGGSMSLLAAAQSSQGLRGVASVSAPMDLQKTVDHLQRSQPLYHEYVLRGLKAAVRTHGEVWPTVTSPHQVKQALSTRTITEFDDVFMAPRHGFQGAADYYARSSCGPHLSRVKVPCLILSADDDPLVPPGAVLPYVESASDTSTFVRTPRGGHVGFISGWGRTRWQRNRAMEVVLSWAHSLLPASPTSHLPRRRHDV